MLLVIDNYDSFTWNLVQLLGELGAEPLVRRNDEVSVADVAALGPERIVISPGPCTPAAAGVSVDVIRRFAGRVPLLGVCLGHQAIGVAFGGRVVSARRPVHGKTTPVAHRGAAMFAGIRTPIRVTRYHSLILDGAALPAALEPIAWTDEPGSEDEIQAIRHRDMPVWGVQFHPESVASECGRDMLRNFLDLQ